MTDELYLYAPRATDPDGDPLSFRLATGPTGMTIDATTGVVQWTPTAAQTGQYPVRIVVDDGQIIEPDLEPEPQCSAPLPAMVDPFTEREQVVLLERRLELLYSGGKRTGEVLRTELLDSASRAISRSRWVAAFSAR